MIYDRYRWTFWLLVGLTLTGCSLPQLNLSSTTEATFFARGLDQYLASGNLTTLKQLPQQYPQGEWRTRAEKIITMVQQQQLQLRQQQQLQRKNKKLTSLQNPKKLVHCQKKQAALLQENKTLKETLKRLKEVLIDTELQAK